jgi:hypothetical protein
MTVSVLNQGFRWRPVGTGRSMAGFDECATLYLEDQEEPTSRARWWIRLHMTKLNERARSSAIVGVYFSARVSEPVAYPLVTSRRSAGEE